MTVADVYAETVENVTKFTKAGFLGLRLAQGVEALDREDLAAEEATQMGLGFRLFEAGDADVELLARTALLASDDDEFTAKEIEDLQLPAEPKTRTQLAEKIRKFEGQVKETQSRVLAILEEVDEIVADGLGLSPAEHETIRQRCQEFPLSITVERPRFAWSPERKRQARRTYRLGERFK